jgi:serine/threonine protein kinase
MNAVKAPDVEPIPGYRLVEPLGRGGYGEVWKCVAPGGLAKAMKFVAASDSIQDEACAATQEMRALQFIRSIRHPFLLSIERVEVIDGELVIVMELADRNLHDLLNEYRSEGKVGIPRHELLNYLRDAAEALDLLNLEHGLQHLDVKPRNLFVVGRHIKVADFGLMNSLAEMHGSTAEAVQIGAATPLYSAPESFLGRISLYSDQYSLAVSYCELLTGVPPFPGKNFRQLALQHTGMAPELGLLSEVDRAVVGRALAKEPGERFPSCLDFVNALSQGGPPPPPARPSRLVPRLKPPRHDVAQEKAATPPPDGSSTPPPLPAVTAGYAAAASGQSLSSYSFQECLARLPVGEVWKARAGDGRHCFIKLVFGCQAAEEASEAGPVARLQALRHEALAPFVVLRDGPNRVALILDQRDGTLADRLNQCRSAGLPGVPREELLDHMLLAGQTLDELYETYRLRHLTLNPRCLMLSGRKLHVADFGLAELIWLPAGLDPATLNPRYAAPEVFEGRFDAASDQYSLALIYLELLTGLHPFRNLSPRQLAIPKLRGQPNLDLIPASDRKIVARALDPQPDKRFPSSSDFAAELAKAGREGRPPEQARTRKTSVIRLTTAAVMSASAPLPEVPASADSQQFVRQLLDEAKGGTGVRELKGFRFRVVPGSNMEHRFIARFLQGSLPIKLEGFRQHWIGKVVSSGDHEVVYHVSPPVKGFQWWSKKVVPTLKLHVVYGTQLDAAAAVPIGITLEPLPGGEHLLEELGPRIFDSIRQFLQAAPDRRREERFRLGKPLRVLPVFGKSEVGEGIVAQALDISTGGLGFYLPCRPASSSVLLEVGTVSPQTLPATILRADRCPDGRYLVGVAFDPEEAKANDSESILLPPG